MKISEIWLREWTPTTLDSARLAERLTLSGHEVESLEPVGGGLGNVIVAELISVEPHPNADRLKVCQVSIAASDPLQIVCGALNARTGLRAVLAQPGARLPNGAKIRSSKLRGVESEGMLCSADELGIGDEHDGIIELPDDAPVGTPVADYLGFPDTIIDMDITPNRGDCFSVLGIAREVSAISGEAAPAPNVRPQPAEIEDELSVDIEAPEDCPRFAGRIIKGIDSAARTPIWMVERLRRSGIRAIHPVVDITNYVLLELGQPLHGYDLGKLGSTLKVRRANAGETVQLLDEKTIALSDDVLVIADGSTAIGLAGIMGGLSTAVDAQTTDVFLEGAFFAPAAIAGRARQFGLHTDASMRFERGVDPSGQARAIERATELLLDVAGGSAGPLTDLSQEKFLPVREPVTLTREKLDRILGAEISDAEVCAILEGLGIATVSDGAGFRATPPAWRFDLAIPEDLIEEIARIHGYDKIPEITAVYQTELAAFPESERSLQQAKQVLVARGYQEILTYSFVDPQLQTAVVGDGEQLALANPLSRDLSVMRRSLLPGLLTALQSNLARQQTRAKLFEAGTCFTVEAGELREEHRIAAIAIGSRDIEQWGQQSETVDFFDIKSDLENLIGNDTKRFKFISGQWFGLHPGQSAEIFCDDTVVGQIGVVHPQVVKNLDINGQPIYFEIVTSAATAVKLPKFSPISRYPAVRRDLAILVTEETSIDEILNCIRDAAPLSLQQISVFDIYRGKGIEEGRKSVALGLILQETSRTLTDEETDRAIRSAATALERNLGAKIRDR